MNFGGVQFGAVQKVHKMRLLDSPFFSYLYTDDKLMWKIITFYLFYGFLNFFYSSIFSICSFRFSTTLFISSKEIFLCSWYSSRSCSPYFSFSALFSSSISFSRFLRFSSSFASFFSTAFFQTKLYLFAAL